MHNVRFTDQERGPSRRTLVKGALAVAGVSLVTATHGSSVFGQDGTPASTADAVTEAAAVNVAIVAAANAFLATLSDAEQQTVFFDWTDTAQKQRWSNFPDGAFERAGLMWGDMTEESRTAWLAVMQTTLSAEGYDRVLNIWHADDALGEEENSGATGGPPAGTPPTGGGPGGATDGTPIDGGMPGGGGGVNFGSAYYYLAVIGVPSDTEPWQWQFGGHHLAVNATLVGPDLALTPAYLGTEPLAYTNAAGETVRPLGDIEDDAFALITLLDATQQEAAVLGATPIDVVLGPDQDGRILQPEGLPGADMTADQQAAFLTLIRHYAGLGNDSHTVVRMAEIEAGLAETYLAWYGPTTQGDPAYFRVTGPTVVIEYSPQANRAGQAPGDDYHVHGVYRDPTNDYGAQYTGLVIES